MEGLSSSRDIHRLLDSWIRSEHSVGTSPDRQPEDAVARAERQDAELECFGIALDMMVELVYNLDLA